MSKCSPMGFKCDLSPFAIGRVLLLLLCIIMRSNDLTFFVPLAFAFVPSSLYSALPLSLFTKRRVGEYQKDRKSVV